MITGDTKEDVVTIQMMTVSVALGVESIGSVHCMEYDTMTDEVFKAKLVVKCCKPKKGQ